MHHLSLMKEVEQYFDSLPEARVDRIDLSVVIPAHNRARHLIRSLAAWSCQDWANFELVVIDDGYIGGVEQVCNSFRSASAIPLQYIRIDGNPLRAGPTIAWNTGLRAGSGLVKACTHPEIMPSSSCARALYASIVGDEELLRSLQVHLGDGDRTPANYDELKNLPLRTGLRVYRTLEGHSKSLTRAQACTPSTLTDLHGFWEFKSDFGGLSNGEIQQYNAFFWNNLFAMHSDVWEWINYLRPSEEWGSDDTDLQHRARHLGLKYVFPEGAYGIHVWHDASCRGPFSDIREYSNQEEARLTFLYPETAGVTLESICERRSNS